MGTPRRERKKNKTLPSVLTQRSGGKYGHMGNIISNAQYTLIVMNTMYVVPYDTGLPPVIVVGSKAVQLVNLIRVHSESLRERNEWLNIELSVKKQMQEPPPLRKN